MSSSLDFMMNFLESDTDFLKFENVALEVMHLCGYNEIKPFGGFKDKGIDATLVKFFDGKLKERTIFQFSMEICTQNKVEKTLKKLEENNIEYTNRLIVEENPTVEELKAWIPRSGLPIKKFFNTSGLVYKELKLSEKLPSMSEEEQIELLATNGKLVKRPLVVTDSLVLVGFKPDEWEKLK